MTVYWVIYLIRMVATNLLAKGMLRNQMGLNQDGSVDPDPNHYGMSWFPGYAINIETGQRLNVAFGEASDLGDQNGRDMNLESYIKAFW